MEQKNADNLLQAEVFRWLRFPLIIGVVFIHSIGVPVDVEQINFVSPSGQDVYDIVRIAFSNVLARVCVPLFFFMSGYFFFAQLKPWNWQVYVGKLRKRARTIMVPYLLWITIGIGWHCLTLLAKCGNIESIVSFFSEFHYWHMYWDCYELDPVKLNWLGFEVYSSAPYHYALWFLRDLMIMMIIAPFFYLLFKYMNLWGLLLLLLNYISYIGAIVPELLPTPLLFFGAGAYFQMNNINAIQFFKPYEKIAYVGAFAFFILCVRFNSFYTYVGNMFFPFFVLLGCISVLCLATSVVKHNGCPLMSSLSESSFFIYLMHTIFVLPFIVSLSLKIGYSLGAFFLILGYLMSPFVAIALCLLVRRILLKFIPQLYLLLTGGRG